MSETSFGPFPTCKEAQVKLEEDKEAAVSGVPEYEYRIEVIPIEVLYPRPGSRPRE